MKASQKPSKPSLRRFFRSLHNRWLIRLYTFIYNKNCEGQHGAIKIVPLGVRDDSEAFVSSVENALLLLGSVYPRGYRRVRRELDYVVNSSLLSFGEYNRALRACNIDFGHITYYARNQTEEWRSAYLACVILHEATHGHLMSHGIWYDQARRVRCERLCVREEERFAARLAYRRFTARLVPEFDESRWTASWSRSRKQERKDLFAHLRQELRQGRKEREGKKKNPTRGEATARVRELRFGPRTKR